MGRTDRETIVALGNTTTWGTAGTVGALTGIIPAGLPRITLDGTVVPDKGIANWVELQYQDMIAHLVETTWNIPVRREGAQWLFWAHLFGDDTKTGASTPWTHTFNWLSESALFTTMAAEINNADIIEWQTIKTMAINVEPDGEGFLNHVVNIRGDTINIAGDATSDGTAFDAVTYKTKTLRVPFRETKVRINAQGGAALAPGGGDDVQVNNFSLAINRNLVPEEVTRGASTGVEYQIEQPLQTDYSTIIFGFDVRDYTTIALLDDFKDQTQYKADLNWAKTVTTAFTHLIELGALAPIPAEAAIEAGQRIPLTRNFQALQPQSTPTGMATGNIIHSTLVDNNDVTYETLA